MEEKIKLLCTLGKMDIPSIQEQPYFKIDLLQTNVLLIGSAGSGKSNFLKILIAEIHRQVEKCDMKEQIYIFDSANSLKDFKDFPLVIAQYDFSNEEYIKRVFYQLETQFVQNVKLLKGLQFSDPTQKAKIPHTTLIIDNINAFLDIKYNEKYLETLMKLSRDGLTKGITIVLTGSSTKGITTLMNYFSQKIALNLSSEEYLTFFSKKVIGSRSVLGGGYGNVTYDASSSTEKRTYPTNVPYELQIFHMDLMPVFSKELNDKRGRNQHIPFPIMLSETSYKEFQERIAEKKAETSHNEDTENTEPHGAYDVIIGVDYTTCNPVWTHFSSSRVLAVYGKRNDEKPLVWLRVLKMFRKSENPKYTFIMVDDGRKKLEGLKKEFRVSDKYYFSQRKAAKIPRGKLESKEIKLSVIQQFVKIIQEQLLDLKDIKRFSNSQQPVLSTLIPGYTPEISEENPLEHCVFIFQAKDLFTNSLHAGIFWGDILPELYTAAEELDWYLIFTDAQRIPNSDLQNHFNQYLNTVILLDDIASFVSDQGRRSVFGEMDVKELKEQYGLCEENDAYFYQVDTGELHKMKCIWEDEQNGI